MAKALVLSKEATRALRRMPANTRSLIQAKLDQLAADPTSLANNVTALKGVKGFRLRVGDWRAFFSVEPDQIIVSDIGPRGSIYD